MMAKTRDQAIWTFWSVLTILIVCTCWWSAPARGQDGNASVVYVRTGPKIIRQNLGGGLQPGDVAQQATANTFICSHLVNSGVAKTSRTVKITWSTPPPAIEPGRNVNLSLQLNTEPGGPLTTANWRARGFAPAGGASVLRAGGGVRFAETPGAAPNVLSESGQLKLNIRRPNQKPSITLSCVANGLQTFFTWEYEPRRIPGRTSSPPPTQSTSASPPNSGVKAVFARKGPFTEIKPWVKPGWSNQAGESRSVRSGPYKVGRRTETWQVEFNYTPPPAKLSPGDVFTLSTSVKGSPPQATKNAVAVWGNSKGVWFRDKANGSVDQFTANCDVAKGKPQAQGQVQFVPSSNSPRLSLYLNSSGVVHTLIWRYEKVQ